MNYQPTQTPPRPILLTAPIANGRIQNINSFHKEACMLKEFRDFAIRGNVMDLAVAVIIGGAFGKIITSLVNDVLMPLIGLVLGGLSFAKLSFKVKDAVVSYGNFIQSIVDFAIVAFVIFMIVRTMNSMKKAEPAGAPTTKECPYCFTTISIQAKRCPHCTSQL
jgi:large conductance mechanosensitive channel